MPEEKIINLGEGVNSTQPTSEPKVVNLGGQADFPDISFDVPSIGSKTGVAGGGNMSPQDIWNNTDPGKTKVPQLPLSSIYIGNRYKSSRPYETDLEEKYAQQQSALDQWKNGALKFVGTATNSFISGTAGTVYGLGAMVRDGRFSSLFDNEINRKLDDSYKALEDALPNYMTQKQTDANWYSPDYLLTANFFSDGILKNLGYSLGTIGGGFAWSKALKAMGITSKLVKAGQGLEALTAVEQSMAAVPRLQKFAAFDGALNSVAQKYLKSPAASVLRNSDRIITSATGTFGEAGLEGLQNMNVFRENAIEEYRNKYGETPTGADLDSINSYADKIGNFTWGMNSLLLTATNYIQLPKILGSSRKADAALINDIEQSVVGGEWSKYLPKTRLGKIGSGIRNVGGLIVSPSEGFEEGAQFAIQTGVSDYFNRGYRNKKDVSNFLTNMNDVMGNITSYGIDQTLYTKEGMSNVLIGALSGGLQQAGYAGTYQDEQGKTKFGFGKSGELGERGLFGYGGERGRNTDIAIEALNKTKSSAVLKDLANYIGIGIGSQKARQAAIIANDKMTEKDMENDFTLSYLMPRVKYGKIEAVNQELSYYKSQSMDNVGFEELVADGIINANETREQFIQRIDSLSALAKQVEDTYSMVRERYSNIADAEGNRLYNDKVIDKLVYATAKVGNYDLRIPQVNSILNGAGINTAEILQSIIAGNEPNKQATQNVLDQINNMDVISDVKEDLKTALADVVDLSLNRRKYIQEYDTIKQNPKEYEEMEEEFGAEEEVPVTVEQRIAPTKKKGKEKIVEKKLEIGKEYTLEEPVLVQNGKLIVQPKISVLSQTLGGELEVQLPDGSVAFLSPEQFRQFKINDQPVSNEDVNYIMDKAITTVLKKAEFKDVQKPEDQSALEFVNSLNNPELVDAIFAEYNKAATNYFKKKAKDEKIRKGNENILNSQNTEVPGEQTGAKAAEYEQVNKKTKLIIPRATISTPQLPGYQNSIKFGADMYKFSNRKQIRGVYVTQANEGQLGLGGEIVNGKYVGGLMNHIKGTSDVDPAKTIAVVMVEQVGSKIKVVGVDGKTLDNPTFDTAVFQVMPDPKFQWSEKFGGKSMFPQDTTEAEKNAIIKEYTEFANETLDSTDLNTFQIEASFGVPQTVLDAQGNPVKNVRTGAVAAGLIQESDLATKPVIYIPTLNNIAQRGSTSYANALGKIFLIAGNGYVPLQNKLHSKKEAEVIYQAISRLATIKFEEGDFAGKEAKRLFDWLRTVTYWGSPKNAASPNSVWFDADGPLGLKLNMSNDGTSYPFTPLSIEANEGAIVEKLQTMYNNVRSAYVSSELSNWNNSYEQILSVAADGKITTKKWKNYQSYLLSTSGRTGQETPLTVPYKEATPTTTNREGIYFVNTDTKEKYAGIIDKATVARKNVVIPVAPSPTAGFVMDGQTPNTIKNAQYGDIVFTVNGEELTTSGGKSGVALVQDASGKLVSQPAIEKLAAEKNLPIDKATSLLVDSIYNKLTAPAAAPVAQPTPAPVAPVVSTEEAATESDDAELTPSDEDLIRQQMNDMGDDAPFRVKVQEDTDKFEKEDWPKIEEFMKNNFPMIPLYRVKNIIRGLGGIEAWGMLRNGGIYVYENAEVGTAYHEVFEAVWKLFSSPEEKINITNEFRNRAGSFVDRVTGETVKYSEATDFQLKEQLAEEFRDFVQYGKVPMKPAKGQPFIVRLFNDLVNFIKSFFVGPQAARNTEELFKRMTTGFYSKQFPARQQLSYAKAGIINISDAFADRESETRIKGFAGQEVNDIMQQMTYEILRRVVRPGGNIFNITNNTISNEELKDALQKTALKSRVAAEKLIEKARQVSEQEGKAAEERYASIIEKSNSLWSRITNNWDALTEKHKEYLLSYNIEFDENNEAVVLEDKGKDETYSSAEKIDNFRKANSAIKLLLSTIPIVRNGNLVYTSINGAKLIPTSEVYMTIINRTYAATNPDEMLEALRQLAIDDENYRTLYERITRKPYDDGDPSYENLGEDHQLRLVNALWRLFNKQNPTVKNLYILDNGDVQVGDSNFTTAARQLADEFKNGIVSSVKNDTKYFEYSGLRKGYAPKINNVGKAVIGDFPTATLEEQVKFLNKLGIPFNIADVNQLDVDDKTRFTDATLGIKKSFTDLEVVSTLTGRTLSINGRLLELATIQAKIENPEFDSVFYNVNGDATQTFIGVNALSNLHSALSKLSNINELANTPYAYLLTDTFAQNSVILNKMFDIAGNGDRIKGTENLMEPAWADGTINSTNAKKKQSSKLTYQERLIQEINMNLAGFYYNLVPGDSSLEHMVYTKNAVSKENVIEGYEDGGINEIFKGYFESELALAQEGRDVRNSKELRFFKSILDNYKAGLHDTIIAEEGDPKSIYETYKEDINNALAKYIADKTRQFKNTLYDYDIIKIDEEEPDVWTLTNLSMGKVMDDEDLMQHLEMLQINFMINNIELHKLLYSDPYQYKDELKRIKNFLSPRQSLAANSSELNAAMNNIYNKGFKEGEIGRTDFTRDYFKTATMTDVLAVGDLPGYGKGGINKAEADSVTSIEQNFTDGQGGRKMQPKFAGKSTMDLILSGDRTRTTRANTDIQRMIKDYDLTEIEDLVGKTIRMTDKSGRTAYTRITNVVAFTKEYQDATWQNEGWEKSVTDKLVGQYPYAIEFELASEEDAFEETDGSGIISLPAHRNFRIRSGDWNDDEELQYRFDIRYEKAVKAGATPEQLKELLKSNPGVQSTYTPIKPIVSGNKGNGQLYNDIVLDKFALYPLSFRVLHEFNPDINAIKLYNKMQREDIDYVIFKSGRKVGAQETFDPYDENDNFNETPFTEKQLVNVPFSIMSTQSDVPSKEDGEVTRGSQITKLVTLDLMETGVPVDYKGGMEVWNRLSEDKKKEASPLYKEIKNNQYILEGMISLGFNNLLNSMGIKKVGEEFEVTDFSKAANTLRREILKREVNDNIADSLAGFLEGKVTLEATPAYQQIRNILYSIADREVISQKVNGGMKVQLPSTFMEENRVKKKGEKGYTSDVLKFYTNKEGQRVAEVMLSRWFDIDMSDQELLDYLNNTDEGQEILKGIGFRIPTQKQNSIDVIKVAKFLPKEFGDSVIIPSALVKKAGSDFDIDKLSVYLKNIYQDKNGDLKVIPYFGVGEKAIAKIKAMGLDMNTYELYKRSLENAYFKSLENLISSEENFEPLITPNSADQLKGISGEIVGKLGLAKIDYSDPGNMLDRKFMSRLRQAFISGKYAIGIAAVNQTNHSLNQRSNIFVDFDGMQDKLNDVDREWMGDGKIKFESYNTVEVNGKTYPSLSQVYNQGKQRISDILSQFIDGFVDIAKGPWIIELGMTPNVASTWMFLTKVGVPIKSVAYFMNQPIIRDYLRKIENSGYSWLFIDDFVKEIKADPKYAVSNNYNFSKFTTIPNNTKLLETLGAKKLPNQDDRAQQQFMLDEFLKYAKMASQLFTVTQGSNFDTATFNDPYLVFKKQQQLIKAQKTIIASVDKNGNIIPGVDSILENSFLGVMANRLQDVRNAYAKILTSDNKNVRSVIEKVLLPYTDLPDGDFIKVAQKAVADLFDWAVQIDKKYNNQITEILLSDNNAARDINNFVVKVKNNKRHKLYDNQAIKLLEHLPSPVKGGVNNAKIKNKSNKVFDQNEIINGFRELKEYLGDDPLYSKIVRLAVLQSGLSKSPISYTSLLPYEDFEEVYNKTLSTLNKMPNLDDFYNLGVFQRNNWNNDDIVPYRKAKFKQNKNGDWFYANALNMKDQTIEDATNLGRIPQLMKLSSLARDANKDYIVYSWEIGSKEEKAEMRKRGDYSYIKKALFKKVYNGTSPLTTKNFYGTDVYTYKQINAWGDGIKANEFYNVVKTSVIPNGFEESKEVEDTDILEFFTYDEATGTDKETVTPPQTINESTNVIEGKISLPRRETKKTKFTVTLNNKEIEKEGYRLIIPEYPNSEWYVSNEAIDQEGFIYKDDWRIEAGGLYITNIGSSTIDKAIAMFQQSVNNITNTEVLKKIQDISNLFVGDPQETLTLQDGKAYTKLEIDGKLLKKLGYTPEEIGNILKEIC
jgi:hypothetical protein